MIIKGCQGEGEDWTGVTYRGWGEGYQVDEENGNKRVARGREGEV